jgi:hypothetical protein
VRIRIHKGESTCTNVESAYVYIMFCKGKIACTFEKKRDRRGKPKGNFIKQEKVMSSNLRLRLGGLRGRVKSELGQADLGFLAPSVSRCKRLRLSQLARQKCSTADPFSRAPAGAGFRAAPGALPKGF